MSYSPEKPFESYKWFFATKEPTESIADPTLLLGMIDKLASLENGITKYNSEAYAEAMKEMSKFVSTPVDIENRVGERNLIRNSGQYWKVFGLTPRHVPHRDRGIIKLTPFAKAIVEGNISQVDFASATIVSFKLPNPVTYTLEKDYHAWIENGLIIHPFKLILSVIRCLYHFDSLSSWLTNEELFSIIIPMAGDKQKAEFIAKYIIEFRVNPKVIDGWYDAVPQDNDKRFSGEFLRFLANFGFLSVDDSFYEEKNRAKGILSTFKFHYISELDEQISNLIEGNWSENEGEIMTMIRRLDINSTVVQSSTSRSNNRPNQARFRKEILASRPKCLLTNYDLPIVLEAAHIKPHAYGGDDEISNGFMLRADIHLLFDDGALRLELSSDREGYFNIKLSDKVLIEEYRELTKKTVKIPENVDIENIKWRYNNRFLGVLR